VDISVPIRIVGEFHPTQRRNIKRKAIKFIQSSVPDGINAADLAAGNLLLMFMSMG
jgi:hypothetical protein